MATMLELRSNWKSGPADDTSLIEPQYAFLTASNCRGGRLRARPGMVVDCQS
jgi:hypothetical protein